MDDAAIEHELHMFRSQLEQHQGLSRHLHATEVLTFCVAFALTVYLVY